MLSDSLALRSLEFHVRESNNNVLSLMSSMDDEYETTSPWSSRERKGSLSLRCLLVLLVNQRHPLRQLGVYLSLAIKGRGFWPCAVSRGYRRNVPKGTATVAVQYREDTAETSGETNFSGVHKEAVQPRLRCSSLGEPISHRCSKNFVQAGPRAPAREFLTRNNN